MDNENKINHDHDLPCLLGLQKTSPSNLLVQFDSVQRELNGNDCGVFAIAFLTEVLCGGDPAQVSFKQERLRPHLYDCIASKKFTLFPKTNDNVPRIRGTSIPYKVSAYIHDDMIM